MKAMATDSIDQLIERLTDDPTAAELLEDVLEARRAYTKALNSLRKHVGAIPSVTTAGKPFPLGVGKTADPTSIAQRALRAVMDAGGKNVTTEHLAKALVVTEAQIRGALKRFVKTKVITKPKRGLWRYAGTANGTRISA